MCVNFDFNSSERIKLLDVCEMLEEADEAEVVVEFVRPLDDVEEVGLAGVLDGSGRVGGVEVPD